MSSCAVLFRDRLSTMGCLSPRRGQAVLNTRARVARYVPCAPAGCTAHSRHFNNTQYGNRFFGLFWRTNRHDSHISCESRAIDPPTWRWTSEIIRDRFFVPFLYHIIDPSLIARHVLRYRYLPACPRFPSFAHGTSARRRAHVLEGSADASVV